MGKIKRSWICFASVFFIYSFLPFGFLYSQDQVNETYQYDSIFSIMKNKSIPIMERYYMTGNIENISREHQITIMKQLIPEAKMLTDKAVVTRLYAIISLFETQLKQMEHAKQYLDSAFIYENQFENPTIQGLMYYVAGVYRMNILDLENAHSFYYKSIECFNKKSEKPGVLTDIYYNLSVIYILWQDEEGLMSLMKEMETSPEVFSIQRILKKTVTAQYYYIQYLNTKDEIYLDYATMANKQAFDAYNSTENPYDVGYQIANNYLHQAHIYCLQKKFDEAKKNFYIAQKLKDPKNSDHDAQILFTSGLISYYLGDYNASEKDVLASIKRLNQLNENMRSNFYFIISNSYHLLALLYEKQKRFSEALEAEKKSIETGNLLMQKEAGKQVRALRVRYNLDQAEQNIRQLTVLNDQSKRINLLACGIIVLALIMIFLLIVRYRSRQKLSAHLLQIAHLKHQEADLQIELQKVKLDEKESEFQLLINETQHRRVQSYLEGLEVERQRLACELHDHVSNELVAIRFKMAENCSREELMSALSILHTEVRAISHDLMPPVFRYATLPEILEDYINQRNNVGKTHVSLIISPLEGWEELPQEMGLEIYRIIQEATGNALKHANAENIEISVTGQNDKLVVEITDDGKGFDLEQKNQGIGLNIIRERVEKLKAHLTMYSEQGKGTTFKIEIKEGE